jgi:glyceraldehyde 3-phosphate dehydrogenase
MIPIRVGLLGLGRLGRQIYGLALRDSRFDIALVVENGQPKVLHHLLQKSIGAGAKVALDSNYLISGSMKSRLIAASDVAEIPWDALGVDVVIDASEQHYAIDDIEPYINNGAKRVILSALPSGEVDRVLLRGINDADARLSDRIISAGSSSTNAAALALKVMLGAFQIEHASMTSVHAYTSDQRLQDDAGQDYRRSRSGANNIVPNATPALFWIQRCLPELNGRLTGYALNVPVQAGSMLDLDISLSHPIDDVITLRELFLTAEKGMPSLIETTSDPVVSSDVKGRSCSLLVDLQGMSRSGRRLVKVLGWHETLGHAQRMLEVAQLYHQLSSIDSKLSE